eukprot:COSAG01_NODE_12990_length_1652_cov_2.455892_2_plen_288_part_00
MSVSVKMMRERRARYTPSPAKEVEWVRRHLAGPSGLAPLGLGTRELAEAQRWMGRRRHRQGQVQRQGRGRGRRRELERGVRRAGSGVGYSSPEAAAVHALENSPRTFAHIDLPTGKRIFVPLEKGEDPSILKPSDLMGRALTTTDMKFGKLGGPVSTHRDTSPEPELEPEPEPEPEPESVTEAETETNEVISDPEKTALKKYAIEKFARGCGQTVRECLDSIAQADTCGRNQVCDTACPKAAVAAGRWLLDGRDDVCVAGLRYGVSCGGWPRWRTSGRSSKGERSCR